MKQMNGARWASVVCVSSILMLGGCSSSDSDDTPEDNIDNTDNTPSTEEGAFASTVDSPILDFSNTTVYWDMETNSIVSDEDDWELSVRVAGRDYQIQVNGGASGDGEAGVGVLQVSDAYSVTDPENVGQVYKYFGDSVSGALSTPGSYGPLQYSVEGNHLMWPTFATYLLKDSTNNLFKMQVLSNYGTEGTDLSGNIVFRYASASTTTTTAELDATDATKAAGFDLSAGAATDSDLYHFAYQKYVGFKLNGGDSGPGGVSGCVAHSYPDLFNGEETVADQFKALNSENTLDNFEAVLLSDEACEGDATLAEDSITPVISSADWLLADYSQGAPVFSASTELSNGWMVRSAQSDNDVYNYARVKVKELSVDLSGAPVRQLVLSIENWVAGE